MFNGTRRDEERKRATRCSREFPRSIGAESPPYFERPLRMTIFPDDAAIDARFRLAESHESYMEWRRLSDWMDGLGALARAYSSASKAEWYERLALRAYQRAKAMEPQQEQEAA